MITKILTKFSKFYQLIKDRKYYNLSYSQEGEDMILSRHFSNKASGFYIDIGAHHPKRFSNTYIFYRLGWRGINIDAMPGSMKSFNKTRKRDINLEKAVSDAGQELTYYIFNDPALNGFSKNLSDERNANTRYKIINKIDIKTEKLSAILSKHLPSEVKTIDFMNVDVEGLDLEVLKSNDWHKYRPQIILVELLNGELFDKDPIFIFLVNNGYKFHAKCYYTFFFIDKTAN